MATTEFGMKVRMELLKRNITNKQLADISQVLTYQTSCVDAADAFEQKKRIAKILEIKEEVKN